MSSNNGVCPGSLDNVICFVKNGVCPRNLLSLMAGFPDELKPPFDFTEKLNYDNPDLSKEKEIIEFSARRGLIMVKSGMIGSVQSVNLSLSLANNENIEINGAVYWIDNASNHGASGGPVVNYSGKLIGIICEKGLTVQLQNEENDYKCLTVPSGATMALSHHLITKIKDRL